jgi:putative membrane-bound dehydrogenase-like protein
MKERSVGIVRVVIVLILGFCLAGRSASTLGADEPGVRPQKPNSPTSSVESREVVQSGPRTPEEALRSIRVASGFRVEMVASEPLVRDPIAFDWGADGRLWVVEMGDYPLGVDGKGAPGGLVKVLEDRDGDGRYDTSTVFLSGMGFPTGVMPWRNGALISRAPDILYAEDSNGDGKADRVEVLLTGFVPGNPQHRVNGFEFGLDGFVYGANGDSGGTIHVPGSKTAGVSIRGRDFRFDPDTKRFELESGQTQFGRHRDDWGHWFGNNNPNWAWHFVMTENALKRNPAFALASPRQSLDLDPRVYPDSRTLPRFNNPGSANKVTSANSPTPYRDDLFGPSFSATLLVSEPVHNLVRRMNLSAEGPTFLAKGVLEEGNREFLASTDNWFRPTTLKTGPDGALWIADMYRAVIEHPEWIPDDVEAKIDLRAGADQGRIYRVLPVGVAPRPIPRLDQLDTKGLVQALESPNGWQRDTAQRLLGHRRDPAAIEPLRLLARSSSKPKTRVQALWTLRNLGGLDRETTIVSFRDAHPQVRRASVEAGASIGVIAEMIGLVEDPDAEVRFALEIALGDFDDPRAGQALGRLAIRDGQDPWARAAILSSARLHAGAILAALFERAGPEGPAPSWVEPLLASACSQPKLDGLAPLLAAINTPKGGTYAPWQFSAAAGLAEAADRVGSSELRAATRRLSGLVEAARRVARDDRSPEDDRIYAIRALGRSEADRGLLVELLAPQVPAKVQESALRTLVRSDDRRVADVLIGGWNGFTPSVRGGVLDALLSRASWTSTLLSSLEDKCVPTTEIPPAYRRRLLDQTDPKLRERAKAILELAAVSPRREVIDVYRAALTRPGESKAGVAVFRRSCVACHRLEGVGHVVGPDLLTLSDASPEALLVAILDPNRVFEAKFSEYAVHLKDGRTTSGLIAGESANSITLLRAEGREDVLLRSEIEAVSASGRSLMPEAIEKEITPREFADLVAYLTALRSPTKDEARPR